MIRWNEVTWYSRWGAIILFLGVVPALCFYIGTQYGVVLSLPSTNTGVTTTEPTRDVQKQVFKWVPISELAQNVGFYIQDNIVYYKGEMFPNSDPSTFLISTYHAATTTTYVGYAKDKNHAYSYFPILKTELYHLNPPTLISGADAKTFEPIYYQGFGENNGNGVDEWLSEFAKDVNSVYVVYTRLPDSDPKTISILGSQIRGGDYAKDEKHVYCGRGILSGADPRSFVSLGYGYGRDADTIWDFCTKITVPNIELDLKTFYAINEAYTKDARAVYIMQPPGMDSVPYGVTTFSVISGADPETFQEIGRSGYMKDRSHVYVDGSIIDGADPSSFEPVNITHCLGKVCQNFDAQDKNHMYWRGRVAQPM